MRILIGCECSGTVRDAFRQRGHEAWSCDLKPCEQGSEFHIQGDIMDAIYDRQWDFIGLHPDCTALASSGNRWYAEGTPGWQKRQEAVEWTRFLWDQVRGLTDKAYLENPKGVLPTLGGMRNYQTIQPHKFGHGEKKLTCLWLHGLHPLFHSRLVTGREERIFQMGPSETRKADRSRTFEGIAAAMADQWGAELIRPRSTMPLICR